MVRFTSILIAIASLILLPCFGLGSDISIAAGQGGLVTHALGTYYGPIISNTNDYYDVDVTATFDTNTEYAVVTMQWNGRFYNGGTLQLTSGWQPYQASPSVLTYYSQVTGANSTNLLSSEWMDWMDHYHSSVAYDSEVFTIRFVAEIRRKSDDAVLVSHIYGGTTAWYRDGSGNYVSMTTW